MSLGGQDLHLHKPCNFLSDLARLLSALLVGATPKIANLRSFKTFVRVLIRGHDSRRRPTNPKL